MKNLVYLGIVFLLFVNIMFIFMFKEPSVIITYEPTYKYRQVVDLYDEFNIVTDKVIDTSKLGSGELVINKDNKKYIISYNVIDDEGPVVMWVGNITIKKGDTFNYKNRLLCVDNHDKKVSYTVEGDYDLDTIGKYNLNYVAVDSSGNKTYKPFVLTVVEEYSNSSSSTSSSETFKFSELVSNYKTDDTLVGIDVSAWQGDVNWTKVKAAGCDFVMIRVGYGHVDNELKFDKYFKDNLKEAKEAGLKVGLYFYSYAKSVEESTSQAKWIVEALNGEKLDLPIAFDFEDWSDFKSYNMSLYDINDVADAFMNEVEKSGYEGMLYGSASYLKNIWFEKSNPIWLAHYTRKTDYSGKYNMWQLSNKGRIDGIYGDVDLNVLYTK